MTLKQHRSEVKEDKKLQGGRKDRLFTSFFIIRVLAGLLSAHLLIKDPEKPFGDITPLEYNGELLELSHDLAARLIVAFENTGTGIPFPRVIKYIGCVIKVFFIVHRYR